MEYYSAIKKNKIVVFAEKWMELGDHHVKQSKPGSEGQRSHVLSHMWNLDLICIYTYI
jgi:hypothetical protein